MIVVCFRIVELDVAPGVVVSAGGVVLVVGPLV